jgi:hypothetical protein
MFLGNDPRIQLGIAARRYGGRKIRQRYLKSFEDVHRRLFI